MNEGFVLEAMGLSTQLLVDQRHTAEGIISLGWLMMASTHRCLSCLSRGCLGGSPFPRSSLSLSLALTTCRHLRWAALFPQRHKVSDTEEWTGKPLCLVRNWWRRVALGGGSGVGWASGFVKITKRKKTNANWSQTDGWTHSYYTIIWNLFIFKKWFH